MYNTKAFQSASQVTLLLQSDVYKILLVFKQKYTQIFVVSWQQPSKIGRMRNGTVIMKRFIKVLCFVLRIST